MFDINKLQTTEIKSVNQISCQTFLILQTVFTQKSRSAVILADITIAHRAHLTDFPVTRPGTQQPTQRRFADGCSTPSMSAGGSM